MDTDNFLPEFQRLQSAPEAPAARAPEADDTYEERAEWSARYVDWFIAQTGGPGRVPPDVRPTHRYEVEFNLCVIDPQMYERETREEIRLQERLH